MGRECAPEGREARAQASDGRRRDAAGRAREKAPSREPCFQRGADSHIEKRWGADAWRLVGVGFCSRELQCTTSLDVRAKEISEECRRSPPARVHKEGDRAAGAEDVGRSPSPEGMPRRAPEARLPAPSLKEEGGTCPRAILEKRLARGVSLPTMPVALSPEGTDSAPFRASEPANARASDRRDGERVLATPEGDGGGVVGEGDLRVPVCGVRRESVPTVELERPELGLDPEHKRVSYYVEPAEMASWSASARATRRSSVSPSTRGRERTWRNFRAPRRMAEAASSMPFVETPRRREPMRT